MGAQPPPLLLYIVGVLGLPKTRVSLSLSAQPYLSTSSFSVVLGEALLETMLLHHHHAVVLLLELSSPTSPSSLLDQGAGDVIGLHVC